MEILKMWGLANGYRVLKGLVLEEANFDSILYNTAHPGGEIIINWVSMIRRVPKAAYPTIVPDPPIRAKVETEYSRTE
jgi:hypothetical protein